MRILHLVKHCHRGHGNAHVAVDLACEQAAFGHKVVYASSGGTLESLLDAQGVRRISIRQEGQPVSLLRNLASLIRLCWTFKPDVIHAHMMSSAVFGYIASKLSGTPLVTTVHNSFDSHSVLMRLGRIVVAVSDAERNLLLTRGFKPDQVVTILNGPNDSPRETWGKASNVDFAKPCIVMICGLHARKGVHDVLTAFSQLQPDFPNWHLNIIGDGPDRAKLEALARTLELKTTHFLGSIETPKALLENSEIFVSASYAEPCGLSTAEARAAGCALVGTKVGGTPELLAHGEAGQLVEPGNPADLARALRLLMQDENTLRSWRSKSLTGSDYFNVHRTARDYDKVYMMASKRRS